MPAARLWPSGFGKKADAVNRWVRYVLPALLWAAVCGYVVWAAVRAGRMRAATKVCALDIAVADSTAQGSLVSSARVREWIDRSGIATLGTPVDEVDLTAIERLVARNGFVGGVSACVTQAGRLRVTIEPRRPVVRLLADSRDVYVTERGYVFAAPRASSLYMPVVTGSYRPPFPPDHTGDVRLWIDAERTKIDRRIDELEREKYPLFRREIENDRRIAALRRMRVKRKWLRFESARSFEARVAELRAEKAALRRKYRYEARIVQQEIDRIAGLQEAERGRQKKLEKSYEDFMKLLTFVQRVEDDDFWRSEVVQIVARTTPGGALEVDLVPRSGGYTILFGRLEDEDRKFAKIMSFYRKGLPKVGWETYRTIDIRFGDQVVCTK